jgi:hypothetical protein
LLWRSRQKRVDRVTRLRPAATQLRHFTLGDTTHFPARRTYLAGAGSSSPGAAAACQLYSAITSSSSIVVKTHTCAHRTATLCHKQASRTQLPRVTPYGHCNMGFSAQTGQDSLCQDARKAAITHWTGRTAHAELTRVDRRCIFFIDSPRSKDGALCMGLREGETCEIGVAPPL